MNKMHTTAKIAAAILGIYLLISTILSLMGSLALVFMSWGNIWQFILLIISVFITLGFAGAVFYFLIYRSDIFAQKIVGREELSDVENVFSWYPFALRLAMVVAGFLFLNRAIMLVDMLKRRIFITFRSDTLAGMEEVYEYGVYVLIYLAVSVYLLCGAPHFVRWQVKKTLDLCKEFPEKQNGV